MGVIRNADDRKRLRRARALRENSTEAEKRLWSALKAHGAGGWKWKRQVPKGPFIADFVCEEAKLIVELDGGQHAGQVAYDARRTAYLGRLGYRVIRFWNSYVLEATDEVCRQIFRECGGERPDP